MLTQTFDPHHFSDKAHQIRAHVPAALTRHGLLPKFTSWRLTQDPGTGLVVLFGVLNDKYIAAHSQTPFGAYFDPRLLHELATDLQVQVIPSNSEGLRYAFILDLGQIGQRSTPEESSNQHIDYLPTEETDSHKPLFLMRDEPGPLAGLAGRPIFARSVIYNALADGSQPINWTTSFAGLRLPFLGQVVVDSEFQPPTLRYPKINNDYALTTPDGPLETLPQPVSASETYNALLSSLGRSAGEFAVTAALLAGIRRQFGITVLISAPEATRP